MTRLDGEEYLVVDRLLDIALRLTRDQYLGADRVLLAAALEEVEEIASSRSHVQRALAEVASAFLRMQLRGHCGKREVSAYRFLQGDESGIKRAMLRAALSVAGSHDVTDNLVNDGIVRQDADGRYRVYPGLRAAIRDLVEPPVLRHWEMMEEARAQAACSSDPVVDLAGRLGCTRHEAADHLRRFPLRRP